MAKLTLTNASGGFNSTTAINANNDALEAEFQSKVLYRDNPAGEPNQMENNLDMNSNRILNLLAPVSGTEPVRYGDVTDIFTLGSLEITSSTTLSSTHAGQFLETTGATNIVLTVPDEATDDLGDSYVVSGFHHGTGTLSFGAGDVTLRFNADLTNDIPQYGAWTLKKSITAADTWILFGYLTAA